MYIQQTLLAEMDMMWGPKMDVYGFYDDSTEATSLEYKHVVFRKP
jgi:hypothetical protein